MAVSRKRGSPPPTLTEGGAALLHGGQASAPRTADSRRPVLQVVELQRFALGDQFFDQSGEAQRPECMDGYDVTLSDGAHKIKCLLSTALNPLVYEGWLQLHGIVRVESWRNARDELDMAGTRPAIVVLTKLDTRTPVQGMTGDMPALMRGPIGADPSWLPTLLPPDGEAATELTRPLPLFGVRKHYLRLDSHEVLLTRDWAAHDYQDHEWVMESDGHEHQRPEDFSDFASLAAARGREEQQARVADQHPAVPPRRGKRQTLPLLGRIESKGPLRFFGKLSEARPQPYAAQFSFWLTDSSSAESTQVTVWNRMCALSYATLEVGDAVLIENYKWSQKLVSAADPGLGFTWEASLNTSGPAGRLLKLTSPEEHALMQAPPPAAAPAAGSSDAPAPAPARPRLLPLSAPRLQTRSQLLSLLEDGTADEAAVDVLGLLLHAYPAHRVRRTSWSPAGTNDIQHVAVSLAGSQHAASSETTAFDRVRWLILLTRGDGGAVERVAVLLCALHCGAAFDELPRSHGEPVLLRGLRVRGKAASQQVTDSGANVVQAAKSSLLLLRSAPCTSVLLAEAIPDTDALNNACAWLNQRPPPPPQQQQRAERTPAPLGTLLGAPPPPLEALCGPATLCACPERMSLVLARLPAVLATLHLRELRPVLVKCFVALAAAVPLEGASQGAAQAATTEDGEGGLLLRVQLLPLNPEAAAAADSSGAAAGVGALASTSAAAAGATADKPPMQSAVLHLREADGASGGGGLWHALMRCADLAAGRRPRAAPPACSQRSVATALKQLKAAPLVLAIDLYKPTYKPGVAEVVAVWPDREPSN